MKKFGIATPNLNVLTVVLLHRVLMPSKNTDYHVQSVLNIQEYCKDLKNFINGIF
jgi:hypothetical protein